MKIVKIVVRLFALISIAVLVTTGEVVAAISLLAFSSMSLGIMVGEKNCKKEIQR